MGGDHGHHKPYTVPDYKIYKLETCPELMAVKTALARKGLKDPWLRNEVWRFNPEQFGTHASRAKTFFLRGFQYGFAAFLVTMAIDKVLEKASPSHHHGDGHH